MVEADCEEQQKKALKALNFPFMDDDALPASFIQRILGATAKWRLKLATMKETLETLEDAPESVQTSFVRIIKHCIKRMLLIRS